MKNELILNYRYVIIYASFINFQFPNHKNSAIEYRARHLNKSINYYYLIQKSYWFIELPTYKHSYASIQSIRRPCNFSRMWQTIFTQLRMYVLWCLCFGYKITYIWWLWRALKYLWYAWHKSTYNTYTHTCIHTYKGALKMSIRVRVSIEKCEHIYNFPGWEKEIRKCS